MKRLLRLLLILLVFGQALSFAESAYDPAAIKANIILNGTTLRYIGKINDDNAERLFELVEGKKVTELVISTSGGEINAGMRIGEWVFDNQIDIVVEGLCMSSGANYIFTAGRKKTIKENSIVGWHGNALQETATLNDDLKIATIKAYEELPEEIRAQMDLDFIIEKNAQQLHGYLERSEKNQAEFFKKIGVDEYVCRIGEEYGVEDFFCLSARDMARFGIFNVEAPLDYENIDLSPWTKEHSVEFIRLK